MQGLSLMKDAFFSSFFSILCEYRLEGDFYHNKEGRGKETGGAAEDEETSQWWDTLSSL